LEDKPLRLNAQLCRSADKPGLRPGRLVRTARIAASGRELSLAGLAAGVHVVKVVAEGYAPATIVTR
jgi:hypothetical protein